MLRTRALNSLGPKQHLADELTRSHEGLTTAKKTLDEIERDYIVKVLEQTHWKVSGINGAAEILGLDPPTLGLPAETRYPQAVSTQNVYFVRSMTSENVTEVLHPPLKI